MSTEELNLSMPAHQLDKAGVTLVDVGDYKLAMTCQGEGFPTVVLEVGWGDSFDIWAWVIGEVAQFTRVCAYDRASMGHSEQRPAYLKPSAHQTVHELHTLWPDEVAGVVLVDSSRQHSLESLRATLTAEQAAKMDELDRVWTEGGEAASEVYRGVAGMPICGRFPNVPLVVLSRAVPSPPPPEEVWPASLGWPSVEFERVWDSMQRDLVKLSPQGRQVIAQQSGHYMQTDEPALVIDAIREVVEVARRRHEGTA